MAVLSNNGNLEEVRIRMYRPGLGDCFLLTFKTGGGAGVYHMLIDCGVLQGSKGAAERMRKIAVDILQTTGCHLDVVVASHEHWDHVCGFRYARDPFGLNPEKPPAAPVRVDQVWMAWTEDLEDEAANRLRARNQKMSLAIAGALAGMAEISAAPVREILKFAGLYLDEPPLDDLPALQMDAHHALPDDTGPADAGTPDEAAAALPAAPLSAGAKPGGYLDQIMTGLRGWGRADPRFLEPGDTIELEGFGVRIYVLGPSRRLRQLGGSENPGGRAGDQTLRVNQATAFLAAAVKAGGLELDDEENGPLSKSDLDELYRLSQPFDESSAIPLEEAQAHPEYGAFFRSNYGQGTGRGQGPEWRRIDADWLQMAETLALQQVSNVNNTSLVLAFELVDNGQVLLFPADAELESWETWECGTLPVPDLLRRTVFYKVGHHGSVNATPLSGGLDLMTSSDLAAMIPVDKVRAGENDWHFPEQKLYAELMKKTKGRVVLNCEDTCLLCDPTYDETPFQKGQITKDSSVDRLWVEYTLMVR